MDAPIAMRWQRFRDCGEDGLPEPSASFGLGAHLVTRRRGYTHHGIYVGEGWVVHYAGFGGSLRAGPVELVSLATFSRGQDIHVLQSEALFAAQQVIERAIARVGENNYRLLRNNCEHLCWWCLQGEHRSRQVERLMSMPRALARRLAGGIVAVVRQCFPLRRAPDGVDPHRRHDTFA